MDKEAIRKTAVCRLEDGVYIVESPLLDICSGIAEDAKTAREIFEDLLTEMYVLYLEGKTVGQYRKRGRPAKGGVALNCAIKPATKERIEGLSKDLGCSQGEVIDYLVAHHNGAKSMSPPVAPIKSRKLAAKSVAEPTNNYAKKAR